MEASSWVVFVSPFQKLDTKSKKESEFNFGDHWNIRKIVNLAQVVKYKVRNPHNLLHSLITSFYSYDSYTREKSINLPSTIQSPIFLLIHVRIV